jgi:hypothetical protein
MNWLGVVVRRRRGSGSKSEHTAVMLVMAEREVVLRRRGGNAFEDAVLDSLVGKRIECEGDLHGTTLLVDTWREVM